ncbi:hypothetical protein CMO89_03805 [Candidatus Woesearchaeota archaeon]|nr:hypothetical protein [Candidatus Woesearchaeota archaeon]
MDKKIFDEVYRMNEKQLQLLEWVGKLKNTDKLIVVEGVKDKRALEKFGIEDIITLKKAIYKTAEDIAKQEKDCIILTDLDREGKKLYKELSTKLQDLGVKVDKSFREFLFRKTKLRQIEGLRKYLEKL